MRRVAVGRHLFPWAFDAARVDRVPRAKATRTRLEHGCQEINVITPIELAIARSLM
jgi:hypothetical protein